jgi:hypothetical protein
VCQVPKGRLRAINSAVPAGLNRRSVNTRR